MKFQEKFKVISTNSKTKEDIIKRELEPYSFDGLVDIVEAPIFIFDTKHNCVMSNDENDQYLKEGGELFKLGENKKHIQVGTFQLTNMFTLQDFFDKHNDAELIVFYVSPVANRYNIFQSGNELRVFIVGGKAQELDTIDKP